MECTANRKYRRSPCILLLCLFLFSITLSIAAHSGQTLRLQIMREAYPIVHRDKWPEVLNPIFDSMTYDKKDAFFNWVAHPMMIVTPDGTQYPLKSFQGIAPNKYGLKNHTKLTVELIDQYGNSKTKVELSDCVTTNLLHLIQHGLNETCKTLKPAANDFTDCMGKSFICHQFAKYLTLSDRLPLQTRFSFMKKRTSKENKAADRQFFTVPVRKKNGEYHLQTKPQSFIPENPDDTFGHVKLQPGTRLFFYILSNTGDDQLGHSGVYLQENYFIGKDGHGNVFVMTLDEYLNQWGSLESLRIEAALPNKASHYCH